MASSSSTNGSTQRITLAKGLNMGLRKAMPDPQPMSMFDHVYAEETEELRVEREGFAAYLESFEGAHR